MLVYSNQFPVSDSVWSERHPRPRNKGYYAQSSPIWGFSYLRILDPHPPAEKCAKLKYVWNSNMYEIQIHL